MDKEEFIKLLDEECFEDWADEFLNVSQDDLPEDLAIYQVKEIIGSFLANVERLIEKQKEVKEKKEEENNLKN